jgi:HK97 family phage major capsid protein
MAVKVFELRQERQKLYEANKETVERAEAEKRALTKTEEEEVNLRYADMDVLAKRISTMERLAGIEKNGLEPTERVSAPLPHEDPANAGRHRYSMLRAARSLYLGQGKPDGLEGEVHDELVKRSGKNPLGFMMPYHSRSEGARLHDRRMEAFGPERRALDSSTGTGSVPTILDKDWIEFLRTKMQVMAAGAREITDLQGKFAIPRQSGKGTFYWVAESGAVTGSNQTLDQVLFTPHTGGAYTDISRRFFELTILDSGEQFVKDDLSAIIGRGVDLAALNGSGASNQPLGILQNTGITGSNTVALGANGGAPTWAALVELYTIVSRGNAADLGEFSYLGNADVTGTLATTAKIGSTFPIFLLEGDKVYGKRYLQTNQLPNNLTKGGGTALSPIIGAIWNQLILAYWTGVDVLVDPYTGSSSGTVRIVALQDMDIQVRHNEAFAVIVDMISNQTS